MRFRKQIILPLLFLMMATSLAWAEAVDLQFDEEYGSYVNMPVEGTNSLTVPAGVTSFRVFDDGGPTGNRTYLANGSLVINAPEAADNYVFQVTGNIISDDSYKKDELTIYEGYENEGNALLDHFGRNASIGRVISSGRTITLKFEANSSYPDAGLDLTVTLVDINEPHTVTSVDDAGGTLQFSNDEAKWGDSVFVEIQCEDGYLLKSIDITDGDGNQLGMNGEWRLTSNPTVAFKMPYSSVTVTPTYTNDLSAEGGLYLNMPKSGTVALELPAGVTSFKLYDDGGPDHDFTREANGTLIITSLNTDEDFVWQITGSMYTYPSYDHLDIYDGDISDNKKIVSNLGGELSSIGKYFSTGKTIAVTFSNHNFPSSDGFNFTVSLVDITAPHEITFEPSEGGSVTCEDEKVQVGNTVTLNVLPEEGYLLKGINVYDEDGKSLALEGEWQLQPQATLTFTMPYAEVRVEPVFTNDLTAEGGLYVNMPKTGTKNVTVAAGVTSFKVYDDGGPSGRYTVGAEGVLAISAPDAPEGYAFMVTWDLSIGSEDSLSVHSGTGTDGEKLASTSNGSMDVDRALTAGTEAALYFKSAGISYYKLENYEFTVSLVDPHLTHEVIFYYPTGGYVTSSVENYEKGAVVTLEAYTENGYFLNGIKAIDETNGKELALDGEKFMCTSSTLSFVMPYSDVQIMADFTNDLSADGGLHIDMRKAGREVYDIPSEVTSFKVYDDGGSDGDYSNGMDDVLVLKAPMGYVFRVSGSVSLASYNMVDTVAVYDGDREDPKIFETHNVNSSLEESWTTGNVLSVYMYSDEIMSGSGLDLTVSLFKADEMHRVVCNQTPGGEVTSDKTSTTMGKTVRLNVTPDEGRYMQNISVADEDGNTVASYEWYAGEDISFVMPSSDVFVTPSFTDDWSEFSINMPGHGTSGAYIPAGVKSFKLYDDGGPTGRHGSYLDGTLVMVAPEGSVLQVAGNVDFAFSSYLMVYDGNALAERIYDVEEFSGSIGVSVGTSNIMAVRFKTTYNDYTWVSSAKDGLDLTVKIADATEKFGINIAEVERGVMVSDAPTANPGKTVVLTGRPEKDGVALAGVRVVDAEQNSVAVTRTSDSTYTFRMPVTDVSVTPSFADAGIISFDENGCLNNGTYFHLKSPYDPSHTGSYWLLSQGPVEYPEVGTRDFTCWKDVYDSLEHDRYSKEYKIVLESDLDFGGYDEENSKCAMAFIPVGNSHSEIDGAGHTIKNFCRDSSFAGFVTKDYGGTIRNLAFENAYIRGDTAGVVAATFKGTLDNVTVRNSNVTGVYAGGISGIVKSNVDGGFVSGVEIASPTNCTEDVCVAYLGGVAGLMQIDDATIQNVRVQGASFKRTDESYDVYAGGIVGKLSLNYDMGRTVAVKNDSVSGVTFTGCSYAGGLLGMMALNPVEWTGITASVSDAYVQGSVTSLLYAGGLVGYVSEGTLANTMSFSIARSGVHADISVTGENSYAGGLVGFIENKDGDYNITLTVNDNYSIGDITGATTSTLGYLIGGLNDSSKFDFESVRSNYHFGTDDALAVRGIGTFSDDGWRNPELGERVSVNIRNAVDGLDADGSLGNGVFTAAAMKTPRFAAMLNRTEYDDNAPMWSYAGNESDLPILAGETYGPIYPVVFDRSIFEEIAGSDKKQLLEEALNNGTYTEESCGSDCFGVILYTDYNGHLQASDVEFMQSLLEDNSQWFGEQELSANTKFSRANTLYRYEQNKVFNVVYHICTGEIEEETCVNGDELEIRDDMDIEGYEDIGFLLKPTRQFSSNDFRLVIPPMLRQVEGSVRAYLPSLYRIYNMVENNPPITGMTSAELFKDLYAAVSENDLSNYEETIHLVYDLNGESRTETMDFVSIEEFGIGDLGYNLQGDWGLELGEFSLDSYGVDGNVKQVPLSAGFNVAVNRMSGYQDSYTVEFGLKYFEGDKVDTLVASDNYIVSVEDFADAYRNTVWRKENLTSSDVVHLDSIYSGLKALALPSSDFAVRIIPQPKSYIVTFNLNFAEFADDVDSTGVFFGKGWDKEKPATLNLQVGEEFPYVYYAKDCFAFSGWSPSKEKEEYSYGTMLFHSGMVDDVDDGDTLKLYGTYGQLFCDDDDNRTYMYLSAKVPGIGGGALSDSPNDIHGTVVLSQKMGGVEYRHAFENVGDIYQLSVPDMGYDGDAPSDYLEFQVSTRPEPGYEMRDLELSTAYYNDTPPEWVDKLHVGYFVDGSDSLLRMFFTQANDVRFVVSFVPKTYAVSFDFASMADGIVLFGDSWKSPVMEMNVEDSRNFPKTYRLDGRNVTSIRWGAESKTRLDFGSNDSWNDWRSSSTFKYFTADVIATALGAGADEDHLTLYAVDAADMGTKYGTRDLYAKAVDENGEEKSEYLDYHGSIALSQSYDTVKFTQEATLESQDRDTYAYLFAMPDRYLDDTLTFNVVTKPDPGYEMEIVSFDDGWEDKPATGDFGYNAKAKTLRYVPSKMASAEGFAIRYNALDYNIVFTRPTVVPPMNGEKAIDYFVAEKFVGAGWIDGPRVYSLEGDDQSMPAFYAVGGCVGWSKSRKADDVFDIFAWKAAEVLNLEDTVFATYKSIDEETCHGVHTITVTAHTDGHGSLELWQFIGQGATVDTIRHAFTLDKEASSDSDKVYTLQVPSFDQGSEEDISMSFEIHAVPDNPRKYYVDESISYYYVKTDGAADIRDFVEGDTITTDTNDMEFHLKFKLSEVNFAFEMESEDPFLGSDWKKNDMFALSDSLTKAFPTVVYTNDKCLAGWSLDSVGGDMYETLNVALLERIYKRFGDMQEDDVVPMYARWTDDVQGCAGSFMRLSIEQENGVVRFEENGSFHDFVNGSIILPYEETQNALLVRSEPDSSYVLDSLVIFFGREIYEEYNFDAYGSGEPSAERIVLYEGDPLPERLEWASFVAYFGKANKTPIKIVENSFRQSGRAISLDVEASEFEVTRAVKGEAKIYDAWGEVVVSMPLGDSLESGFSRSLVLCVDGPGEYTVVVMLYDDRETSKIEQYFEVESMIPAVAARSWQMMSLAAVDTSELSWDNDQVFYWWDAKNTGEFWQYKRYQRGGAIEATRGYWYNSLRGRPLALRPDFEDNEDDVIWNLESDFDGWNLVANPHNLGVDLFSLNEEIRADVDEEAEISFWVYDAETGYRETDYLEPFGAVWVKVSKPREWKISATPAFEPNIDSLDGEKPTAKRRLAKVHSSDRWTLQLALSDNNGRRDSWNLLGAGPRPFVTEEPPAAMGDHVNLSIVEGDRLLAKSIKAAQGEMEWTIALSATSERVGYLSLEGIDDVHALGYHVYVTVDGTMAEMFEGTPLRVYLKSSGTFATVRVAPAPRTVVANAIRNLRSVRVGNRLQVSFDASEGLAGAAARIDLLDMNGRVVNTSSVAAVHGSNNVLFDAPKTGLYILRVRAGSVKQVGKVWVR